jgi:hypothetical protein
MPQSHDPNLFNITPYYDDYDETKKFLRTIFRPGRSVQARELTQLQTVLQMQVERFGSHLFDTGSVILGGEISESNIRYAVPTDNTTDLSGLVGEKITDGTVTAQVYHTLDDDQTVFFQYITQGTFADSVELGTTGEDHAGITFMPNTVGIDATLFTINEGVYFVDGYFVLSDKQSIVPYDVSDTVKTFENPTNSIGWNVGRNIKTADDDNTLRDPASGFYNYNAPGADRYTIELDIKRIPFTASLGDAQGLTFDTTNYIELIRMVGGSTTKKIKNTDYADIEETFARRTYDESGNYTVNTPGIEVKDYNSVFGVVDNTKFVVGIGPNKSYVGGYEIDTQNNVYLAVDKPSDSVNMKRDYIDVDFGNYVLIDVDNSGFGMGGDSSSTSTGFMPFNTQKEFELRDGAGLQIGTTNFRTLKTSGTETRAYIFNTKLNDGKIFKNISSMLETGSHTGTTGSYLTLQNAGAYNGPFLSGKRSLILPTTGNRLITDDGISDSTNGIVSEFIIQKVGTAYFPAGGSTAELTASFTDFVSGTDTDYMVVLGEDSAGAATLLEATQYDISKINNEGDVKTIEITLIDITIPSGGVTASVMYPAKYSVQELGLNGQSAYRTLTLTAATADARPSVPDTLWMDGATHAVFELSKSHIEEVNTLHLPEQGIDVDLNNVIIDKGQRETSYNRGKIFVPISYIPAWDGSSTLSATYTYWNHSEIGPVTVDSWIDAGVDYYDIPIFTDPDSGNRYDARTHIDFRPTESISSGETFTFTEYGIPYHNTIERTYIGYNYYLPRIDKVCLCKDRVYRVIKGTSSIPPTAPQTTSDDMDLYNIIMKPHIFDIDEDVKFRYIDNKRFTMRQIGEIEDNLDRVEVDSYLETLRNDAFARASGMGGKVLESGIFVDDFSGHAYSDVTIKDHNCSMDFTYRGLHPSYTSQSLATQVNNLSTHLTQSDDGIVTYKYNTSSAFSPIDGSTLPATGSIEINPYGNTDFLGTIKLTPSSDVWYDQAKNPKVLVNTFGENNAWEIVGQSWTSDGKQNGFGTEYKEWTSHWIGEEFINNDTIEIDPQNRSYKNPVRTAKAKLPGRITETINDRVVDKSVVPYMREVGITFDADGMLPGATVYPFFDGTQIGSTSGYLVDIKGSVTGNVTIPSGTHYTGEKLFRLTDSSTNTLISTTTAADVKFYAQGSLNCKNSYVSSVRPPVVKRRSVTSEDIIDDYFEQNLEDNYSEVVNGLEPLSQEFIVDYGVYPQGVFLKSVEMFFKKIDTNLPVTIQIRPMVNGIPHPSIVVPFSEVTVNPTTYKIGPDATKGTTFTFSSPVYLNHGRYTISILSNSPDNIIFKAVGGEMLLDSAGNQTSTEYFPLDVGTGIKLGSMFIPLNNGSRAEKSNETIQLVINRCSFITSGDENALGAENNTLQMYADLSGASAAGHIINVMSNEQPFTSELVDIQYNFNDDLGIIPNKDIKLGSIVQGSSDSNFAVDCVFSDPVGNKISPVIDLDRFSMVLAKRQSYGGDETDGGVLGETQIDSSGSNTKARYISKIVTTENGFANTIAVTMNIAPKGGYVLVFVKTDDLLDSFDDNNWLQLEIDDDNSGVGSVDNQLGNATHSSNVTFRPTTDNIGGFSRYAIKVIVNVDESESENNIPSVQDLRVVPIQV